MPVMHVPNEDDGPEQPSSDQIDHNGSPMPNDGNFLHYDIGGHEIETSMSKAKGTKVVPDIKVWSTYQLEMYLKENPTQMTEEQLLEIRKNNAINMVVSPYDMMKQEREAREKGEADGSIKKIKVQRDGTMVQEN